MPAHTLSRTERARALLVLLLGSLVLLATSQRKWEKNAKFERTLQGPSATRGAGRAR